MRIGKPDGHTLACLLIACLLPLISFASPPLKLEALTKAAIENNKDLRAARYSVLLAASRLKQAGLWPNPSLQLSNTDDRLLTNEGEYSRSIGFSQAFPISGRLHQQKNVARVDIAIAMGEIRNAKRQLRGQVADSFYALLITEERLKQLNKLLSINQQLMQVSQKRFHAAEVSELDANTAKLEYQRILQEKQSLTSFKINQQAQLNQLLGRSKQTPLLIDRTLPKSMFLPSLEELQKNALEQRPEMQIAWLSFNRSQAAQQLARAERWADWTIGLGVQQDKIAVEGAPLQRPDRAFNVNITIPLPLVNRNQGRIMETNLQGTQNLMKIKALSLTIKNEVASNYGQVMALQTALRQSQSGETFKLINRNVTLAREAYRNGQISLLEVLQIQRQQNELQTTRLNILEKYLQAVVKLCTALGNNRVPLCSPFSGKRTLHVCTHHEVL
ncbi:TolC family protein [Legionella hackeliae]|uniref:Chemiosmotic efflux system C protein C n=1 Tax=Legionella hackeliae TaxID=449 RepID=A0A0A8USC8_LEGHA|nr:TolC family protein [Legionella hackeliae]KTD10160.1 chemiosmotic efflux system C protein C [Legionella hackeliae]CEK09654.1 Chemiosmotic efflux system C protein C [Legionella hackeliae]STX49565.1 chemiosmotic efflux system C protein C [Legionella hackeliae]